MKITVEGIEYEFDEDTADNTELMAIEDVTGQTVTEWAEALGRGSMRAITALIWILRRRSGESDLAFSDVRFRPTSLSIENESAGKDVAV